MGRAVAIANPLNTVVTINNVTGLCLPYVCGLKCIRSKCKLRHQCAIYGCIAPSSSHPSSRCFNNANRISQKRGDSESQQGGYKKNWNKNKFKDDYYSGDRGYHSDGNRYRSDNYRDQKRSNREAYNRYRRK